MQKLEERNTYTPTDIPHVRSNCDLSLNREETLSMSDLKTSSNNSDAALTANRVCRTELASTCQCYSGATESGIRQPIRYSATNYHVRRGTYDTWGLVVLRKGCMIGSHSVILPGVIVGENAKVGAFSLVKEDIPEGTTAFGIPARVKYPIAEIDIF